MTNDKLDKAIAIRKKMSEYDDIIKMLNDNQYDHFNIHGVCSDGVSDYIDLLPDDCLKAVKQWYIDEWIKLKEEFEKI